jgi:hypothetical protein
MTITPMALILGLVTGLLGVWLFLFQSDRNHQDYRVTETRAACQSARFNSDFDPKNASLKTEAEQVCGEFEAQQAQRVAAEIKAQQQSEELKRSLENALKDEVALASAVSQTATLAASSVKSALP